MHDDHDGIIALIVVASPAKSKEMGKRDRRVPSNLGGVGALTDLIPSRPSERAHDEDQPALYLARLIYDFLPRNVATLKARVNEDSFRHGQGKAHTSRSQIRRLSGFEQELDGTGRKYGR